MSLRPLAGIRVVEVGPDLAAAFGSRLLADLGAEVIKVEPPGSGDPARHEGPFVAGAAYPQASALFGYLNYGKRSVTLDHARASGAELLRRLAARADLLVWSPAASEQPGLAEIGDLVGAETGPVVVAVTSYGLTGPDAGRAGSPFVVQHAAGFAYHQACPVSDPERLPPVAAADREGSLVVGLVVAIAAVWGLEVVRRTNAAPLADVSAEDVFAHLLVEPYADWLKARAAGDGRPSRQRAPGTGTAVVGGMVWLLPCADGHVLVSPREDHQWARWIEVMGRPRWSRDPELCKDRASRTRHAAELQRLMAHWSIGRTCAEIFPAAQAARVACFPISGAADLLRNPQLRHRRFFHQLRCGEGATVSVPGLPFAMVDAHGACLARGKEVSAPDLGEGDAEVWGDELAPTGELAESLRRFRII